MQALGVHVFAGGFTMGVKKVFDVKAQLELHGFGLGTARSLVPVIEGDVWQDWPRYGCEFTFANPRCTGFSCITSGYDSSTHGPWAKQTIDVHDFCHYSIAADADIIIWESVQQAFSTGRPLLDYLRDELFVPKGYKIAHLFVNAATFGNAQNRRRYFFVAYRSNKNFNIVPPRVQEHGTILSTIDRLIDRPAREMRFTTNCEYSEDCYLVIGDEEKRILPYMKQGWCMNRWSHENGFGVMEKIAPSAYECWLRRNSCMPFSLHCINRPRWQGRCPTLHSSCCRIIHPVLDRPLTVLELSVLMGWDMIPRGPSPFAQLAKGIVPAVGEWLAEQAKLYLDDVWGDEDWASKYNGHKGEWEPALHTDVEKVIDMTQYFKEIPK